MITKTEVLRKINDAIEALEAYRAMEKRLLTEDDRQIKKRSEELIKEAQMLGSSGRQCPTCNGSGRI